MRTVLALALLAMGAGCGQPRPAPVDIESADMCSFCRMAISERRYAAELLLPGREALKFDDIGCMLRFAGERKLQNQVEAMYVMDFDRRDWLDTRRAFYVQSPEIRTPMGSGLIAFGDRAQAERNAARYHGRVLAFEQLWSP